MVAQACNPSAESLRENSQSRLPIETLSPKMRETMSIIPAFERWRREDQEIKIILHYIGSGQSKLPVSKLNS